MPTSEVGIFFCTFNIIDKNCQTRGILLQCITKNNTTMKQLTFTKDVAVERVKPLPLHGTTRIDGPSYFYNISPIEGVCPEKRIKGRIELFIRYAHRLLECSDKIFADRRIFNAKVPLQAGFAKRSEYGTYEFQQGIPTLGTIIDWWQNYECAKAENEKGEKFYICGWSFGSMCKFGYRPKNIVSPEVYYIGHDGRAYISPVKSAMHLSDSIYEVYKRYPQEFDEYEVFTLEEVIKLLFDEDVSL